MRVELAGQVALITGSAQGIGRAIADTLAANGATVVYSDRQEIDEASAIRKSGHFFVPIDVSKRDSIEAGVASAVKQAGRIDILVNNAGIGVRAHERKTVDEFPVEAWDELLSIDLTGVFLVSRTVIPHMKAQGTGGRIINICSVLGLVPMRLQSSYVAAKAGAVNLTRSMALELAPDKILVNGIAPGSTATEGWAKWIHQAKEAEDAHARLMSHIPLGRPASTQEIANGALFLAAPESSYITGHILTIDGGWTAGFSRDF
jgi:NAD(P)-dependent dehydrogenase (short-subunit alcohol dehydrogenase family)